MYIHIIHVCMCIYNVIFMYIHIIHVCIYIYALADFWRERERERKTYIIREREIEPSKDISELITI